MQEVKPPKKPLLYYYCIAMLVLLVLNAFLFPRLMSAQVEEVGKRPGSHPFSEKQ